MSGSRFFQEFKYKYTICASVSIEQHGRGWAYDQGVDTLAEGKTRAKHILTEAFRISGEMLDRFGYVQILNQKGECVWEYETREAMEARVKRETEQEALDALA